MILSVSPVPVHPIDLIATPIMMIVSIQIPNRISKLLLHAQGFDLAGKCRGRWRNLHEKGSVNPQALILPDQRLRSLMTTSFKQDGSGNGWCRHQDWDLVLACSCISVSFRQFFYSLFLRPPFGYPPAPFVCFVTLFQNSTGYWLRLPHGRGFQTAESLSNVTRALSSCLPCLSIPATQSPIGHIPFRTLFYLLLPWARRYLMSCPPAPFPRPFL